MGVHAVTGGEDIGQVGAHRLVDDDGAVGPEFGPGIRRELGIGTDSDDDEHQIERRG